MVYGDLSLDAPFNPLKGFENGACNRQSCQAFPALYFNHGSHAWYCVDCAHDIGEDVVNKRSWSHDFIRLFPNAKEFHPMFETREQMDARKPKVVYPYGNDHESFCEKARLYGNLHERVYQFLSQRKDCAGATPDAWIKFSSYCESNFFVRLSPERRTERIRMILGDEAISAYNDWKETMGTAPPAVVGTMTRQQRRAYERSFSKHRNQIP